MPRKSSPNATGEFSMTSTNRQSIAPVSGTAFTNRVKASGPLLAVNTTPVSLPHAAIAAHPGDTPMQFECFSYLQKSSSSRG